MGGGPVLWLEMDDEEEDEEEEEDDEDRDRACSRGSPRKAASPTKRRMQTNIGFKESLEAQTILYHLQSTVCLGNSCVDLVCPSRISSGLAVLKTCGQVLRATVCVRFSD